jgi:hypothetical protein
MYDGKSTEIIRDNCAYYVVKEFSSVSSVSLYNISIFVNMGIG